MTDSKSSGSRNVIVIAVALASALILWAVARHFLAPPRAAPGEEAAAGGGTEPTLLLPASPELLELGKSLYEKQCSACHGVDGKGEGPAAYLLYPKPRDLVAARYRLVSTWEGVPTDSDLYRTISRGMPGSAMPSWAHLPEKSRWGLVHIVKSFAAEPFAVEAASGEQSGVIEPPPAPPFGEVERERARELFAQGCAPCHGAGGKGDGVEEQRDAEGFPTRPRDLTAGIFKGSPEPVHVYRRLLAGMPGTPMPSSSYLSPAENWALVSFVRSLSSDEQRARTEMKKFRISAPRVAVLPSHPDEGLWRAAPRVNLHLMPLWWRPERPEELTVQALHDGDSLALLLGWADETNDHTAMRPQDFRDAAAVQFSAAPDPPFFAMGEVGAPVNIWMWKSERQADLEPAFQDLEKVYPHLGIDSYPNLTLSPLEQPVRNALTLSSDPIFATGWGAGNIVSDPTRRSPAEDLTAQGFGTLSARPRRDQTVHAAGVYSTGCYRIVLRRTLAGSGPGAVALKPGTVVSVAFAVWNGSAGDRDGKKSVTIWQDLKLE